MYYDELKIKSFWRNGADVVNAQKHNEAMNEQNDDDNNWA
jgi:hypothetical protein